MNEENNFQGKLSSMINACALQARWHHEQYVRLQYCQQYFIYLLHNKHCLEKDYLEDFFQNITSADNATLHPWSTQTSTPWVHPSNDINERRESSTSEVLCKRKKRKKKKNKRKTSQQVYENDDNESESDLEVDEGFKAFHRETARFRAERDSQKNKTNTSTETMAIDTKQTEDEIEVEYVDILHKGPEGTKLPPTAQNRKELYEKKYGKQGTTVLSLETALQWKFNKVKDSSSPVMWPAIPIRMVYD